MWRTVALLAAALALSAALPAQRAEAVLSCSGLVCTDSVSFFAGGSTDSASTPSSYALSQFDPALGTLDQAFLHVSATKLSAITIASANPASAQETVRAFAYMSSLFGPPDLPYWFIHLAPPSPVLIFEESVAFVSRACILEPGDGCTDGATDVVGFPGTVPGGMLPIADPAPLVGTGSFDALVGVANLAAVCELTDVATGAFLTPDADRTCNAVASSTLQGSLTIEYRFTPAVASVPAPASLPLLAVALAGLAAARRRRHR